MLVTRVGYAGGSTKSPNYSSIGDHTESFQVLFDPAVISYPELLELFFEGHDPTYQSYSVQYQNAVFYENDAQLEAINAIVSKLTSGGQKVWTRIEKLGVFTQAEDYHQKHDMRMYRGIIEEISAKLGPGWLFSTEATKINGYLGGGGTCKGLEGEVRGFGLSKNQEDELLRIVCKDREGRVGVACPVPARSR